MVEQKTQVTGRRGLITEVREWWMQETSPPNPIPFMILKYPFDRDFWKRRRSKAVLNNWFEHLSAGTSYECVAISIHNLYNGSPRVRRLRDEKGKISHPSHGFTAYPLDEERRSSLPAPLRDFFGEEITQEGTRFNILTDVFRSERTEGDTDPIPEGAIEVAEDLIGDDINGIFQMFSGNKQFEIRVKIGGYYYGGECNDLFSSPNRSLKVRFLPAVNGEFKLGDPRNFETENKPLSSEQDELLAGVLAFAVNERLRQLPALK